MNVPMHWSWVLLAATAPLFVGALVAWPFWRMRVKDEMGTIAGVAVVMIFAVFFISREFGEVLAAQAKCQAEGHLCRFSPEPFTRYAMYAGVAMLHVFLLFMLGLTIEERIRRKKRD